VGTLGPEVVGAGGSHGGGVKRHNGTSNILESIEASRDAVSERVTPHGDGRGGGDGGGSGDGGGGGDSRGSSVSHRGGNGSNNRLGGSGKDGTASGTVGSTGSSHSGGLNRHHSAKNVLKTGKATGDRVSKRVGPDNGGGGSDGGSGGDSRGSSISHRGSNSSSNDRLGRSRKDSTTSGTVGSTGSSHSGGLDRHHSAKNVLESSKATGDGISKRVGLDDGGGGGDGGGSSDGGSSSDSRGSSISHRGGNSSNNRLGRSREDSTTSGTMGSTGSSHGGGLLGHYSAENILESGKATRNRISKGDSLDNSRGGSNGGAIAISSTGGGSNSGDEAKESKQDLHDVS